MESKAHKKGKGGSDSTTSIYIPSLLLSTLNPPPPVPSREGTERRPNHLSVASLSLSSCPCPFATSWLALVYNPWLPPPFPPSSFYFRCRRHLLILASCFFAPILFCFSLRLRRHQPRLSTARRSLPSPPPLPVELVPKSCLGRVQCRVAWPPSS